VVKQVYVDTLAGRAFLRSRGACCRWWS